MGIRDTRVCNDNSPHLHRPSHPAEILFDGPVLTIEGFKQRECAHCGHATVHPCTAAGCSCLCPECGWDVTRQGEETLDFTAKRTHPAFQIGVCYDLESKGGSTYVLSNDRTDGISRHCDADQWVLLERAAVTQQAAVKAEARLAAEAKAANKDFGQLTLGSLRRRYVGANSAQRAAILAAVVEYLS